MKAIVAIAEAVSRQKLQRELKKVGIDSLVHEDAKSAWAALQEPDAPALVVLDVNLPGTQIEKFCERIRGLDNGDEFFIILLLAGKDIGVFEIAESLPIYDCLGRPIVAEELRMRVRAWQRFAELQFRSSLRASHDTLTGLWNHGLIMEVAQREIERAGRDSSPMALLVSDVDALGAINEYLGPQGGDTVLNEVADRMRITLRSYDMFGRYGGGKFMVVLPRCTRANALEIADRLRKSIVNKPVTSGGKKIGVTTSIGVASVKPGQSVDADKLFRAADHALFRAKQAGRNRVELAISLKSRAGAD